MSCIADLLSRVEIRQQQESMTSSVPAVASPIHGSRDQRTGFTDFSIDRLTRTGNSLMTSMTLWRART